MDQNYKQQILSDMEKMFQFQQKECSLLYYSGKTQKQTGNWQLSDNVFISLEEIVKLWKKKQGNQAILLIIIEGEHSGQWVKQLKAKKNKFIAIQASNTAVKNKIQKESVKSLEDTPDSQNIYQNGIFTQDLISCLTQQSKKSLNLQGILQNFEKESYEYKYLQPSFYCNEIITSCLEIMGLPIFFNKVEDMKIVKNLEYNYQSSKKQTEFLKTVDLSFDLILRKKNFAAANKLDKILNLDMQNLSFYKKSMQQLQIKLDLLLFTVEQNSLIFQQPFNKLLLENSKLVNQIGIVYYNGKVFSKSIQYFRHVLSQDPKSFIYNKNYLVNLLYLQKTQQAQQVLQQTQLYIKKKEFQDILNGIYFNFLCIIEFRSNGDFQKGVEYGEKAMQYQPQNKSYLLNMMNCFIKLGNYDVVIPYLKNLMKDFKYENQKKSIAFVNNQIGVDLFRKKEYQGAVNFFIESYNISPQEIMYNVNIIDSFRKLNKFQEAYNHYEIIKNKFNSKVHKFKIEKKIKLVKKAEERFQQGLSQEENQNDKEVLEYVKVQEFTPLM